MAKVQTIFRNGSPTNPYAQIRNACLQDKNLKQGPAWVLMLCLSLPRDWRVSLEWVAEQRDMNIGTVRGHIRTLEELGYCKRLQSRSGGRFDSYEFAFTDQPHRFGDDDQALSPAVEKPSPVRPAAEKPAPENPSHTKKKPNQQKNNKQTRPIQRAELNSACEGLDDDDFDVGLDDAQLIAEAREAAEESRKRLGDLELRPRRLEKLPFSRDVVDRIHRMGLDVPALVAEYRAEVGKRTIANPDGYLIGMARKRVAARDGIAAAEAEALLRTFFADRR